MLNLSRLAYVILAFEGERWNDIPGTLSAYKTTDEKYVTADGFIAALDNAIEQTRLRSKAKREAKP